MCDVDFKSLWGLDPEITFLNHGSFGACPLAVHQSCQAIRDRLERCPGRMFIYELEAGLDRSRFALASFLKCTATDLALIPNTTTGFNSVLRSIDWRSTDEILTTTHAYNACRTAMEFVAGRCGARVVRAELPFPFADESELLTAILDRVTEQTRLVVVDHITSPSAVILPVQRLIDELNARGIESLIDGAHAPGMVPLNLDALQATYFVGNCHKWMCAPKTAAFLYVRPDRQAAIRPLAISHGANSPRTDRSRFFQEFDWTGTYDPAPLLSVPAVIEYFDQLLPGGWDQFMRDNHAQVVAGRRVVAERLDVPLPCPDEAIGSMATLPLPARFQPAPGDNPDPIMRALFHEFSIDAIVGRLPGDRRYTRMSSMLYNTSDDYRQLGDVLSRWEI
jgi:isopenicillin-N epimerase